MAAIGWVFVSVAEDGGIDRFSLDLKSGHLSPLGRTPIDGLVMPLAVDQARATLHASIRSKPYRLASFSIDTATGQLTSLGEAPVPSSMAGLALDRSGDHLLAASYADSCVSVSRISADGSVAGAPIDVLPTGRHAHAVGLDRTNRHVLVPCLGSDQIFLADFDSRSGAITPRPPVQLDAGHGPRHLRLSADNRHVYVLCELSGHVVQLELDAVAGTLRIVDSQPTVPAGLGLAPGRIRAPGAAVSGERHIWCADLHMTANGRFLMTSERTTSTLTVLEIEPGTGRLRPVETVETCRQPRGFAIDPSGRWLVASGERSDHIVVHGIDPTTGRLSTVARAPVGRGANWVEIVA